MTETNEVPLSVALPLVAGAGEENREELVDLWARLLAAAMDRARQTALGSVAGNPQGRGPTMAPGLDFDIWNPTGGGSDAPGVSQFAGERFARGLDYPPWGDDYSARHAPS